MLFAHMKQQYRFTRLKLRGLSGAPEEFSAGGYRSESASLRTATPECRAENVMSIGRVRENGDGRPTAIGAASIRPIEVVENFFNGDAEVIQSATFSTTSVLSSIRRFSVNWVHGFGADLRPIYGIFQ